MQTFLPYADFARSAVCLDRQRLGKQRLECLQLLRVISALNDPAVPNLPGWSKHPAVLMWRWHAGSLVDYGKTIISEWVSRGYKNTIDLGPDRSDNRKPNWFGRTDFHASHRAALLYKNYEHYSQFNWTEEPKLEYVWPR